jgi:hypothetical protein
MNNWSVEELDRQCKENKDLAQANGIVQLGAGIGDFEEWCWDKPKPTTHSKGKVKSLPDSLGKSQPNKYHAVKTEVDGIVFDSKKEAARYQELCLLQKAYEIFCLCCHVRFPLPGKIFYEADFIYLDAGLQVVVEDVKSSMTRKIPVYRMKKKLFEEKYGLNIHET